MSNPLFELLAEPEQSKLAKGTRFTPQEIRQQPETWRDSAGRVYGNRDALIAFLKEAKILVPQCRDRARFVLAGAGSSDFAARCLTGLFAKRFLTDAEACPSTDIITHPSQTFLPDRNYVVMLLTRSGESPETVETYRIAADLYPRVRQIAVTCNAEGDLAKECRTARSRALLILLSDVTNDRGLAMTSSFTNMVIAGQALAYIQDADEYLGIVERLARAGENVLTSAPSIASEVVEKGFSRAFFLGSGCLKGCATEAGLKLQEMTSGAVMCGADSFLGIRHGPQASIRNGTVVCYFVSSDPYVRRYELDLIRENNVKGLGRFSIAVVDSACEGLHDMVDYVIEFDPDNNLNIPDAVRPPIDVILGQLLGLFSAIHRGLKPDAPSREGVINRVVEGVAIYPRG